MTRTIEERTALGKSIDLMALKTEALEELCKWLAVYPVDAARYIVWLESQPGRDDE